MLGQDLGLRQGRDRHFSWPRPSPRISLCQGRHSVSRLDGLHKSTRVWRVAAQATQAGRGCSPPSVRKMPERARFLSPVTGSALRALREHRLRTDKFRPSTSAAWSSGESASAASSPGLVQVSADRPRCLRALLRLVEMPVLPEKQRSAVDMTIHQVQSSTPQRPHDGAARLTLARGYAYMGAGKLRDSQIRGRMSWSAS